MSSLTGTAGNAERRRAVIGAAREAIRLPAWFPYLLRVSAAATIAMFLAFWLQLPTPYSAVTTVYIVANPVRGAIVSKSVWRIAGTIVGAVVAIVQTAVFGQAPLLFDLVIAVWMGICCAGASLLRFFPSYGTVLAGYTVVIVDVGVFSNPDNVLATAFYRMSVVVLGIVVCGMVFLLTQRGTEPVDYEAAAARLLAEVATLIRRAHQEGLSDELRSERRRLAQRLTALEQDIVYGGSDNIAVRHRAAALRVAITRLLGALTSGFHVAERVDAGHVQDRTELGTLFDMALERAADASLTDRAHASVDLERIAAELASRRDQEHGLDMLAALEQARDTLERLARALADLNDHASRRPQPRLVPFLEWSGAIRNGIRGALVVILACLGWYLTRAPAGPTLLGYLVPAAALLSTTPSPGAAAIRFVQGCTVGTVVALVVQACVLPQTEGFPLLMVVLLATAAPGIALQVHPKWGGAAFGYLVFMNTQIAVDNPMRFNLSGLLNNAEMYLFGNAAMLLVFRILLPPDPAHAARNLARSLAASAARLARRRVLPDPLAWENVQLQKILRYGQRLDQMGTPKRNLFMAEAAAALILGRILLQLRLVLRAGGVEPAVAEPTRAALATLRHLRHAPARRAASVERCARSVMHAADALAGEPRGDALRIAALLHEAARVLHANALYFDRNTTAARIAA